MTCPWPDPRLAGAGLDRRSLLALLAAGVGAAVAPRPNLSPAAAPGGPSQVFFHHHALHLDGGRRCVPYLAPAGARALAPLARLSEAQIRGANPYL